jgi:hypothetical protein
MSLPAATVIWCSLLILPALGAEPIDGRSAGRWLAQPGWTPTRVAERSTIGNEQGWLAASLGGQGKQMTWTLAPTPAELAGEPQWLVLRYRATGIDTRAGDMLLAVQAGGRNWFHFFEQRALVCDGREHTLAVDVWSYQLPAPIEQMLLRIGPASAAQGKLLVRMEFADQPPAGATTVVCRRPKEERVTFAFKQSAWKAAPQWIPNPSPRHAVETTGAGVRFSSSGPMTSMRWSGRLATPPDLRRMPVVAVRYRATGAFGPYGYVFYLGTTNKDPKRRSVYAMRPGDVVADGRWHVHVARLDNLEPLTGAVAVGIDSLSPAAQIELDYIAFSSTPPRLPLEQTLDFQCRAGAWPAGQDGLVTVAPAKPVAPRGQLLRRLGLDSWFGQEEITVEGIPFRVPSKPEALAATGTIDEESVAIDIPQGAKEVLLLLATSFPHTEKFGASAMSDTPLVTLDEPERMALELVYADGTADQMLPLSAATGRYGLARDLGLYAVRPAAGKTAVRLLLHDRMRNAAFGLVGVTVNRGRPRFKLPETLDLRPAPAMAHRASEHAATELAFANSGALTWQAIRAPLAGPVCIQLAGQPVFRLLVDKQRLASTDFRVASVAHTQGRTTITATLVRDELRLSAQLETTTTADGACLLALRLANAGQQPVTGRLEFPTVERLRIGTAQATWYLCGRRGGVINHVNTQLRDEIGESHPLALDGFFNAELGWGVSFMPRDLEGVFRWYRLERTEAGGSYALEFLPQTVAAGGVWTSVPVAVAVTPGDWRAQFHAYRRWVATWHKPLAPRKPWFRSLWSFPSISPRNPPQTPLDQRLDFLALAARRNHAIPGVTDYVHLFGWAQTEQFGHWGAYDHYQELGGREHFRQAVARAQQAGQPVGLYLDGYLVSTKSDKPSQEQIEQWAVRTADGQKLFHPEYDAHSMCPYVPAWREHLCNAYRRVAAEVQPNGMYLDEFGRCMTSRICYNPNHGHPVPMGMCAGEWRLSRQMREAVPPTVATYCEFVPADVATQYLDGAYGHVALDNFRGGYGRLAPHFVNLHRFALPDFKTFELIYYVPLRNGNWFLLKYPFFNGDGYYLTDQELRGYDEHSRAFLSRVFKIQHAQRDAFTAPDVEPLVATRVAGLYANRFSTARKTVWTLLNTNYQTVRGGVLCVATRPGATYWDAWHERPISAQVEAGPTVLHLEVGPRAVGCVVQTVAGTGRD